MIKHSTLVGNVQMDASKDRKRESYPEIEL